MYLGRSCKVKSPSGESGGNEEERERKKENKQRVSARRAPQNYLGRYLEKYMFFSACAYL